MLSDENAVAVLANLEIGAQLADQDIVMQNSDRHAGRFRMGM
jgi:hypothetical protein